MEIHQNSGVEPLENIPGPKSHIKNRSEGIARTGYLIPGRDGIPGLDLAGNSSVAVVVVVALQPWTHQKNIKGAILGGKKAPAGTGLEIPGSNK